uniref:ANK_REP_REGION domain-containing protein n=1 Tax=Macrostomum lignano TaxID=282301 RepID=A0A1I8GKR9_9PLAT
VGTMAKSLSGASSGSLFSSCTLYLANLPAQATATDIARMFEPITGRLVDCQLGQSGTGLLVCQRPDLAERAYNTELAVFGTSAKSDSNTTTTDESRLCSQANRALNLNQKSTSNSSDTVESSLRCSRQALELAIRERNTAKLEAVAAKWPGGTAAFAEFCSVNSGAGYRGTGFLPLVHDLVSEARKPKELLLQLIECCRVGLDEKQAADTVNRLVNSRDQYGFTPLHRAVRSGSDEAAEILLANGADATAVTDRDRRTALHIHLWLGCGPLAYRLLDSGADPDACDADNWTPLHWCAKNAHLDFAKHLICKRGGCTLSPLKLCLQQINQCVNGPMARTQQQQQPQQQQQQNVLQSLFAIARLLLRHGAVLPAQSFLADWLVATSNDNV